MNTKGPGSENATLCVGGYALMYLYIISTVKEVLRSHIGPRGLELAQWSAHCKDWAGQSCVYKQHFKVYVQKILLKKFILYKTETTQRAYHIFPQFIKINSQIGESGHPQGKQVCYFALRNLISLSTCTHMYKAPEIHSCQGSNLNSEPIVFLQLSEHNKGNCSFRNHS